MMTTVAEILGSKRQFKAPARWAKMYQRLCAERDRLQARDYSGYDASRVKLDDLTDAAGEESENNLSLLAASATQDTIFEVVAAIRRIERGSFGVCELTGKPIEADRLEAIPWTRYSLEGQQELEASETRKRTALPPLQTVVEQAEDLEESEDSKDEVEE